MEDDDLWPSYDTKAKPVTSKNTEKKKKQGKGAKDKAAADELKLDFQYDKDSSWKYNWAQQNPKLSKVQEGGVGAPLGMRYASLAHTNKHLSFATEVTRDKRAKMQTLHLFEKKPVVGQYFPKHDQVANRPRSQGFSQFKRKMYLQAQSTRGDAKIIPQAFNNPSLRIPDEFQKQIQKLSMQRMAESAGQAPSAGVDADGQPTNNSLKSIKTNQQKNGNNLSSPKSPATALGEGS